MPILPGLHGCFCSRTCFLAAGAGDTPAILLRGWGGVPQQVPRLLPCQPDQERTEQVHQGPVHGPQGHAHAAAVLACRGCQGELPQEPLPAGTAHALPGFPCWMSGLVTYIFCRTSAAQEQARVCAAVMLMAIAKVAACRAACIIITRVVIMVLSHANSPESARTCSMPMLPLLPCLHHAQNATCKAAPTAKCIPSYCQKFFR